jgi:hypothetical protein
MRYRHHGDKIVWRVSDAAVTDCPCRPAAGAVVAGLRKSLTIDDLKKIINRPPCTLAELADKIRNFWSRQC